MHEEIIRRQFCLLLTASINVNKGMYDVYLDDPAKRLNQYLNVFRYYLEHEVFDNIVFVENSGYPLDPFLLMAKESARSKQVEVLSLSCNDYPAELGKGYGESLLLHQALEKSSMLKDCSYFGKLTGRLILKNMMEILRKGPDQIDFMGELKRHSLSHLLKLKQAPPNYAYCDTRFFVASVDWFCANLRDLYQEDGYSMGKDYYRVVNQRLSNERLIPRFTKQPRYIGEAGHWNKSYGGWSNSIGDLLKGGLRRLAPSLWF